MARWVARIAALAACVVGCSPAVVDAPPGPDAAAADARPPSDGGGSTGTSSTCITYAYARCSYLQNCSPTAVLNRYGSTAQCQTIFQGLCENSLGAPSTGTTAGTLSNCETALPGWVCDDYLYNENIPPACQTALGSLPAGSPCGLAQQCRSGYCALPLHGACGTCEAVPPTGASCAALVCPPTLTCVAATQTCVAFAQEGASCSVSQPCSDGLTCVVAAGATTGVCEEGVATANSACSFTGAGCNFYQGLTCNVQTGQCATATLGVAGQACGIVGAQSASCIAGLCVRGACQAYALPGAACDTASGPTCTGDARCIIAADGGTAGTCQLNGASACP